MGHIDVFHQSVISGREFEGVVSSTGVPFICCTQTGEGMPLHQAALQWMAVPPPRQQGVREGWFLIRAEKEPAIFLSGFTAADASQLGEEFGIPTAGSDLACAGIRREYFLSSPAWEGLRAWVERYSGRDDTFGPGVRGAWWFAQAIRQIEVRRKLEALDG